MKLGALYDYRFVDLSSFSTDRPWVKFVGDDSQPLPVLGAVRSEIAPGPLLGWHLTWGWNNPIMEAATHAEVVGGGTIMVHPLFILAMAGMHAERDDGPNAARKTLVRIHLGDLGDTSDEGWEDRQLAMAYDASAPT